MGGTVSRRHREGKWKAKKRWFMYYHDDNGKFCRKRITLLRALFLKACFPKYKWKTKICENCETKFKFLGRSYCPNCGKIY